MQVDKGGSKMIWNEKQYVTDQTLGLSKTYDSCFSTLLFE